MKVNADKAVLTSAVVTMGSTAAASMLPSKYGGKGELPPARLLFGTSLTFMGLSYAADFAPNFVGPLAAAIGVTALTYYGIPVLDNWFNGKHNPVGGTAAPKGTDPNAAALDAVAVATGNILDVENIVQSVQT